MKKQLDISQGHWSGVKADPTSYFGFIYQITDKTTGQSYIGRKQFWMAKQKVTGCKSKSQDRRSPKWKECCWSASNWKVYKGSSKNLAAHMKEFPKHNYQYSILKQYASRGTLTYGELKALWQHNVLTARLPNGDYKYFNRMIGAIKFRPNLTEDES